jgi:hypothetical protein
MRLFGATAPVSNGSLAAACVDDDDDNGSDDDNVEPNKSLYYIWLQKSSMAKLHMSCTVVDLRVMS